jgi:hypothetical protein
VEGSKMREVVLAGDRFVEELQAAQERQACFEPPEFAGIADARNVLTGPRSSVHPE